MATPVLAPVVRDEPQLDEQEGIVAREDTRSGVSLLLEAQRRELEVEIKHAESILDDQPDTEFEHDLYSKETLDRGVAFLKMHVEWIWKACGTKAPTPTIGRGPRGSVDLYWKRPSFELLVNIPASADDLGTFYGRDNSQQTARGSFDPKRFTLSIATWLMM